MKILEAFKDLEYLGYRNKHIKHEPTESYFFVLKKNLSYLRTGITFYHVLKELSLVL